MYRAYMFRIHGYMDTATASLCCRSAAWAKRQPNNHDNNTFQEHEKNDTFWNPHDNVCTYPGSLPRISGWHCHVQVIAPALPQQHEERQCLMANLKTTQDQFQDKFISVQLSRFVAFCFFLKHVKRQITNPLLPFRPHRYMNRHWIHQANLSSYP